MAGEAITARCRHRDGDQRFLPVSPEEVPEEVPELLLLVLPALSVAPELDILVVPVVPDAPEPDVPEAPEVLSEPDMLPAPDEPDEPEVVPELPECFFDFDLECLPVCLSLAEPVPVASWPEPLCMPVAEVPPVVLPVPVPVPLWAKAKLVTVARTAAAIIDLRIVDSWVVV